VISNPVVDYFRCPALPPFVVRGNLSDSKGFFRFGDDAVCYGHVVGTTSPSVHPRIFDASEHVKYEEGIVSLPFDIRQIVDNLRYERYVNGSAGHRWVEKPWVKNTYYRLRPMMAVSLRKHLQKFYLQGWDNISFPGWPVDRSVDILLEKLVVIAMNDMRIDRLPFIWFWPDRYDACAILTHDVETSVGRDFSDRLMDIDDEFGVKASFQIVPEKRYGVPESFLESIRQRGFEINVQGLDHDGDLFACRREFLERAKRINQYAKQWGALGFRSPILYRNSEWFADLDFEYDMSVPNTARMEAQRGGCCTAMPYTLPSGMTELPVTMAEDYTLLHILNDYSATLWKQQMKSVLTGHGLMNFIIHPDYLIADYARTVYKTLLEDITRLRNNNNVWVTLPKEVSRWWRDRSEMKLVRDGRSWRVEGVGSSRARVAWAHLEGDRLFYEIESAPGVVNA
jgi:hypothetical protein